jgi:hypothetical protein
MTTAMPQTTIGFGLILIVLGVGAYVGTGGASVTALLPAVLGVPILLLGLVAQSPNRRRFAIGAAALIALLGLLGSLRGVPDVLQILAGGQVDRPIPAIIQMVMVILAAIYLALAASSLFRREAAL